MIKKYAIIAAMSACISNVAIADTFNYSSLNIGYESFSQEIDGISEDLDGNGLSLGVSFGINDNVALIFEYTSGSADISSSGVTVDMDINATLIGAYYHTPINKKTDVILGAGLLQGTVDVSANGSSVGSEDVDGHLIRAGIRSMVSDKFELNIFLDQSYIEDDSDSDITLGGAFYLQEDLSLNATFTNESDGSSTTFSISKKF